MASSKEKTASLLTELGVEDLYGFLEVQPDSTEKQITRAYRKKALKYHPDKNPDNPNAADMFQKLSKVLTVLTDPLARGSYDRWLKAKQAAQRRHEELNAKRRKLKEKLEERESQQSSVSEAVNEREAAASMQREIERLREESQRRIQEQAELLRQQMARGMSPAEEDEDEETATLKVTWKAKKSDQSNGGYDQALLDALFSRYGPLHHVLISGKRRGKALVSFHSGLDAAAAVEKERGMPACPLTVAWVCGQPKTATEEEEKEEREMRDERREMREEKERWKRGGKQEGKEEAATLEEGGGEERDYESIVLMKLRQAEERKRLCEELANSADS